jgi:PAS domain S-box-containing protein
MPDLVTSGWSQGQADCRRVFEDNALPMWIADAEAFVEVNAAAALHYGYSRAEFLAMTIRDLEVAEGSSGNPSVAKHPVTVERESEPPFKEHQKKDGTIIDVEIASFAIQFGGHPAVLSSASDVTYRRRTEAQTRYLDLLLATITDAVVASDDKFILTSWNAAAESTYGRRADEVLGQPDALVFRTDFVGVERAEAIQRLVETGRFHGELTHRRQDGKRIHIESRAAAFFDKAGKRLGYVSVNRDITERRYAEETIRALLSDVMTAQEEERRRIARELHDETAQTLTSLLIGLKAVEGSQSLGQAQGAAGALRSLVVDALEGVQRMARGLRPSVLDDLGLEEALERLSGEVARANPFGVEVHVTGPRVPRLPEALESALYRVAQEALMNVTKHAGPSRVSVLLHRTPRVVRLVVEDDGKGFDSSVAHSDRQLGLVGMRERAHLIGGAMTIESSAGRGTTICVSVPLPTPPVPS